MHEAPSLSLKVHLNGNISSFNWTCKTVHQWQANWQRSRPGDSNWQLLNPKWVGMQHRGKSTWSLDARGDPFLIIWALFTFHDGLLVLVDNYWTLSESVCSTEENPPAYKVWTPVVTLSLMIFTSMSRDMSSLHACRHVDVCSVPLSCGALLRALIGARTPWN